MNETNNKQEEQKGGDGQYDAFVRALRKIYKVTLGRNFPTICALATTEQGSEAGFAD